MTLSIKQLMRFSIVSLVVLTVVLPSGNFLGFNYKFLLISICGLFCISSIYLYKSSLCIYFSVSAFLCFLAFYFLIGFVNGVPFRDSVSHVVAFGSLFSIIFFSLYVVSLNSVARPFLGRAIFFSALVYCLLKVIVCFFIGMKIFSPEEVQGGLSEYFGFEFIGLDAGYFYRIHIPIDFLLPFVFLVAYFEKGIASSSWRFFAGCLFGLAVLISYSRILYFIFFVSLLLVFFSYFRASRTTKKILLLFFGFAFMLVVIYFASDFILERYSGEMAEASDGPRVDMYNALVDMIISRPILGGGLGSGSSAVVRFEDMPWYYELQWLSFIAQFGVVGFALLLALALFPVAGFLNRKFSEFSFSLLVVYFLWLGVGVFNGFMLTSSAGVIFLFFILLFCFPGRISTTEGNG